MPRLKAFLTTLLILTCTILNAQPGGFGGPGGGPGGPGGFGGPGGPGGRSGSTDASRMAAQMQRQKDMNHAYISGTVVLSPDEEGGEETPGAGVTIIVVTENTKKHTADTSYAIVGQSGTFLMRGLQVGTASVTFTMMGYEDQHKTVTLNPGENKFVANLKPVTYALDGAVVKESVKPVSIKEDTIIFHAAAVKTEKGEMAIDILEQMPGVEVGESSVKVLNENVENVYIDGALLFGDAPMKALNNLPAEEVVTIKSYQEYANKDPRHKISKNESKQRVLDIQTKSRPTFVINGDTHAGGGFDTDSTYHKFRYTLGGQVMAASEKLQANVSYNINNINDASTRRRGNSFRQARGGGSADLKMQSLNVNVNRNWMSPTTRNYVLGSLGGSYSFSDSYNVSESVTERIYFPTSQYTSRSEESSSWSASTSKQHNFALIGMKAIPDGKISSNVSYTLSDNVSDALSSHYNYQDALARQGTSTSSKSDTDGRSFNASLSASKGFFDKLRARVNASYTLGDSDGTSAKIDTTTSTISTTVLDISNDARNHSLSTGATLGYELSERSTISLSYSYGNTYRSSVKWAYDLSAGSQIDTVNTYNRTYDNNTHNVGMAFRTAFHDDKVILSLGLNYKSTGLNRSDAFPEVEPVYSRRFNALIPSLTIGNESQLDHWNFSWSASSDTPSIEQLRPRLDNSNLYSVSVGNPDLRQGRTNSLSFAYSTVLGSEARETMKEMEDEGTRRRQMERFMNGSITTFSFNASFSAEEDMIVTRRDYYSTATYLPEYGYTMPAQSSLTTYENASGRRSASANASFGIPVGFIKGTVSTSASASWDRTPSYINSVLVQTQNFRPTLTLGYRSNFSRRFRLNANGSASYIRTWNSEGSSTDYFTEAIRAGFEVNRILKKMYVGGNYTKTFMQGVQYTAVNDNILDLNGGVRFGPRNNIDIAVTVHDIFNRTKGFSTSMSNDYITNSWNHNFGRYVLFTIAYRFNRLGKGSGNLGMGGMMGGPGGGRGGMEGGPGPGPMGGGPGPGGF